MPPRSRRRQHRKAGHGALSTTVFARAICWGARWFSSDRPWDPRPIRSTQFPVSAWRNDSRTGIGGKILCQLFLSADTGKFTRRPALRGKSAGGWRKPRLHLHAPTARQFVRRAPRFRAACDKTTRPAPARAAPASAVNRGRLVAADAWRQLSHSRAVWYETCENTSALETSVVGIAVVKPVVWGRTPVFATPPPRSCFSRDYSPVYITVAAWYSTSGSGSNSRRILKHMRPLGWS